ncbi:MAG: hypothetical protein FJW30_23535, partial [Acidobacteria bacterium]|nr:hypothetical protein [Acidobacteriota bacterium]
MIRIFRVFVPANVVALAVTETILLYLSFIVSAFLLLEVDPEFFLLYEPKSGSWPPASWPEVMDTERDERNR